MDDLLSILKNSNMISMPELVSRLHTSEAFIYARLERYEQLGVVKRVIDSGGSACSGSCGNCKGCGTHKLKGKPSVYWVLGDEQK